MQEPRGENVQVYIEHEHDNKTNLALTTFGENGVNTQFMKENTANHFKIIPRLII